MMTYLHTQLTFSLHPTTYSRSLSPAYRMSRVYTSGRPRLAPRSLLLPPLWSRSRWTAVQAAGWTAILSEMLWDSFCFNLWGMNYSDSIYKGTQTNKKHNNIYCWFWATSSARGFKRTTPCINWATKATLLSFPNFVYFTLCLYFPPSLLLLLQTCGKQVTLDQARLNHEELVWHGTDECFVCAYCSTSLLGQPYLPREGKVFCSKEHAKKFKAKSKK